VKSILLFMLLFLLVLGSVAGPTWADVIPIQNASFEITNPLNIPCSIPANCNFNFGPIPDWTLTGQGGSWHPSAAFYNLPLPDGSIVAFSNGGTISQTLNASLIPNTSYTFSVDVGHRLDGFVTNYTIAIYAGSMLLDSLTGSNGAIPIGTFADETLTFTSGANVAPGDLRIVLTSAGSQADFDDVRLMTGTPEPASLSLLAVGCGLMLFVFRRR
jgi:hypothetical protein